MIKDGFSGSVMIASDMFGNNMWDSVNKSITYGGFFTNLKQYLLAKFSDIEVARNILGLNALRFLSAGQC
jgi:hypothetical protein